MGVFDDAPRIVAARGDLAVWEMGEGEPVLVLHGFPDAPIGLTPLVTRLAAAGFRCIVPALPGYLPSSPVDNYQSKAVAHDMLAVLDALGLERAPVVGHDWGGCVALDLGADHAERITRVVSLAIPHPAGFAARRRDLQEQKTAAYAWILAYSGGAATLAADPVWLDQLHAEWSPGLERAEWPAVKAVLAQHGVGEAVHGWYRDDFEATTSTGDVLVPTLMLHGANDGCIRCACFRGFEDRFPAGLDLEEVPGVGHWLHCEAPDQVAARIVDFLSAR
ncbi:MAG: alpha/beta hydrolase [Thermoleophilia bacterium]